MADDLAGRIISLVVFACVVACVIGAPKLRLRLPFLARTGRRFKLRWSFKISLPLDLSVAPLLGVVALVATTTLSLAGVWHGIAGDGVVRPWVVIIVFFSTAYLCLALDNTGMLKSLAYRASRLAGSSGHKLFASVYAIAAGLTLASNDVVILTLTQLVGHLAKSLGVSPLAAIPLQFAEFFSANVWSQLLVTGNPTNVIVADTFRLSFISYIAWMALPTLAAGVLTLVMLWLYFRRDISNMLEGSRAVGAAVSTSDVDAAIPNKPYACFAMAWFVLCLTMLVATSWVPKLEIWHVTLFFAGGMLAADIVMDIRTCSASAGSAAAAERPAVKLEPGLAPAGEQVDIAATEQEVELDVLPAACDDNFDEEHVRNSGEAGLAMQTHATKLPPARRLPRDSMALSRLRLHSIASVQSDIVPVQRADCRTPWLQRMLATRVGRTVSTMPWNVLPFVVGMFMMVQALQEAGWISWAARRCTDVVAGNLAATVFFFGFLSTAACQVLNNQPMTILFARIISSSEFVVSTQERRASLFAVAIGSNLGANVTIIGALAGIMWQTLLRKKQDIHIGYLSFFKVGIVVTPLVLAGTLGVLLAESAVHG
eukprot:jgi/Chlat1/6399/Chrsp45S05912